MTDAFDEAWDGAGSTSGGDAFDAAWDNSSAPPASTFIPATGPQAERFVGKSLLEGGAKFGDVALSAGLDALSAPYHIAKDLFSLSTGSDSRPEAVSVHPLQTAINYWGLNPDTEGLVKAPGAKYDVTKIAKAATEGAVNPIGGPVSNALASVGSEVAKEMYPESKIAPFVGALVPSAAESTLSGLTSLASKPFTSTAEGLAQKLVGYNPSVSSKIAASLDEAGQKTAIADAVEQASKSDLQLQNLKESGFFDKLSPLDSPKNVSLKLAQHGDEAGSTIGDIIKSASEKESSVLDNSATPWQKAQYLDVNSPTFDKAQQFVDELSIVNKPLSKTLDRKLTNIKENWNNSDRSLQDLKDLQSAYGEASAKSFNPNLSASDQAAAKLDKLIYGDLAGNLKSRITNLDPALGEALNSANKAYSAVEQFKNSAFNASRKSVGKSLASELFGLSGHGIGLSAGSYALHSIPVVGPLLAAQRALTVAKTIAPVLTMKAAGGAGSLLSGLSGLFSNASSPLAGTIQGALGASQPNSVPSTYSDLFTRPQIGATNSNDMENKKTATTSAVEHLIDTDPYSSAVYEVESGRNPNAQPRDSKTGKLLSSAKGGFQFIDKTAKALGLKNPFDLAQSYTAFQKLTEENKKVAGEDPMLLYSAHYLGAPLLEKFLKGKSLTETEQQQVQYLKTKALPRFAQIYQSKIGQA